LEILGKLQIHAIRWWFAVQGVTARLTNDGPMPALVKMDLEAAQIPCHVFERALGATG
jgi:hypothetical protein